MESSNNTNNIQQGCAKYPQFRNSLIKHGFCAFEYPIQVDKPRMVLSLGTSDALILERGRSYILLQFKIWNMLNYQPHK